MTDPGFPRSAIPAGPAGLSGGRPFDPPPTVQARLRKDGHHGA